MNALISVILLLHNFYHSSILTVKWQNAKFDRNSKFHLVKYSRISLPQRVKNQKFPKARITRPTRSQSSSVFKFLEPKCQTATYQKCYIIRCIRVWKVAAYERPG